MEFVILWAEEEDCFVERYFLVRRHEAYSYKNQKKAPGTGF